MSPVPSSSLVAPSAGRARHSRGFTLIELMTVGAVLAITLMLAAPALSSFVQSSRVRASQSELVSSLMLARSEAARRGVAVRVDALGAVAASAFNGGWRVWVDANANGTVDTGEVLRALADRGTSVNITSAPSTATVTFNPNGFVAGGAVTFTVCGPAGTPAGTSVRLETIGLTDSMEITSCP